MKGWIADLLRTAWSFLYWNLRKSWFRLRRARGRCPCQNPSDSGAAHVTGCDAVIGWAKPARFRRVCPLLEQAADGRWCCRVNAAQVRPFWGRAAAAALVTVAALWLGGTLAVFGLLRARGYALDFAQVAWPPTLQRELPRAQAAVFLRQAKAAYESGKPQEAIVALTSAWQDDPANYAVGITLAQFSQAANPRQADQIYTQLRATHPEKRGEVTQAWLFALLTHGDYPGVATLAVEELTHTPAETAWLHALIFACRQTKDATPLEEIAAAAPPGGLAPALRETLLAEARALHGTLFGEALRQQLARTPPADAPGYMWYWQAERLTAGGWPREALALLRVVGGRLPGRAVTMLTLEAQAVMGAAWDATRLSEIKTLLAAHPIPDAPTMEVLCTHLISHPHPEALAALAAAWQSDPQPPDPKRLPLGLALYCAAAVGHDAAVRRATGDWLRQATGGRLPDALGPFAEILGSKGQERRLTLLLPALPPMPLEVVYALLAKQMKPE